MTSRPDVRDCPPARLLATLVLLGGGTLFPACSRQEAATQSLPPLPKLELAPQLDALKRLAASRPAADAAELRAATEFAELAVGLVETDERTTLRAERALLEHPAVLAALAPLLAHEQPAVRTRAAWLLGRSGQPLAQFPLLLRLKDETDATTVYWIAEALLRCGNDTGLDWLLAGMQHDATAEAAGLVAIEVCRALDLPLAEQPTYAELQDHLRPLAEHWRRTGIGRRRGVPPPDPAAVDAIVAAHLIATEGTQLRPVDEARFVLTRSGRLALPLLQRVLSAAEPYLRTMALQVLAGIGPPAHEAADAVLPLLGDPLTASYAIRTLGEIGAGMAAKHLRARLTVPDSELRAAAAAALGLLRDQQALPPLRSLLAADGEPADVRVQAAFAVLCFGRDQAAEDYLLERQRQGDYHAPTLQRLRERLAAITGR